MCRRCGRLEKKEDAFELNGRMYCKVCVKRCDHCGEYHARDIYRVHSEGVWACGKCIDRYYEFCDECDDIIRKEDIIEAGGMRCCEGCYDRARRWDSYWTRRDNFGPLEIMWDDDI